MEWLKSIILGIIQGITEYLPVSSTGHMILFNELFPFNQSENFISVFLVFIQTSSVLAVIILYFNKLNPFKKDNIERSKTITIWKKVIVATIPASIIGFLLSDIVESKLSTWWIVSATLFIYGVLFLLVERKTSNEEKDEISYKDSLFLGLFQVLSLIPGTSRSGSVILGGRFLNIKREAITEFSFFMAIPIILGATILRMLKYSFSFTLNEWSLLILGFIVSFIVSYFTVKKFIGFVKKHSLKVFGYYRIILSVVVTLYFLLF